MKQCVILAVFGVLSLIPESFTMCQQGINCNLPNCFCSTSRLAMDRHDIPQIIYFGFDDALNVEVAKHYRRLFTPDRKNPNGCPISMSLYVQHQYTDYRLVNEFYNKGMEIGVHSVTHQSIDTGKQLLYEADQQRKNLANHGRIPIQDIVGWRSPNLKTAGDIQPDILKDLGYEYDISLTYLRNRLGDERQWPYTLDYGYPFSCMVQPCPGSSSRHPGFWEVPVNTVIDFKNEYPCPYVDGCINRAENEEQAFTYLWQNFLDYYEGSRSPLGFNMHAAWFFVSHNANAMDRFIQQVLTVKDVYIVNVKQLLDWMREPTRLSNIQDLPSWNCGYNPVQVPVNVPTTAIKTTPPTTTMSTTTVTMTTSTTPPTTTTMTTTTPSTTTTPTTTTITTPTTTTTTSTTATTTSVPSTSTTANAPITAKTTNFPRYVTPHKSIDSPKRPVSRKAKPKSINEALTTTVSHTFTTSKNGAAPQRSPLPTSPTRPTLKAGIPPSFPPLSPHLCVQGLNCKLPDCMCRTTAIPSGIPRDQTPQMVYFTFDGPVTFQSYINVKKLFASNRKNPNNCSVSATLFVSRSGNFIPYLQHLADMGLEVGLRGDDMDAYRRSESLGLDLGNEITYLKAKLPMKKIRGWRSPALKPLGDAQYSIIKSHDLMYDSTISLPFPMSRRTIPWPYTLDFNWQDRCDIGGCPTQRHPGLWEVPVVPLLDYKNQYPCTYADGCMFNPPTADDTFNFLWNNFKEHFVGNRSPLGITLRQQWFSHPIYRPNLVGLNKFIRNLLSVPSVYIVSIEDVVQWIRNPTPLAELADFQPWKC